MRVVEEFNHRGLKCTVFHYNSKYSLQIENERFQQKYKLSKANTMDEVARICDAVKAGEVDYMLKKAFIAMEEVGLHFNAGTENLDDFEELI